MDLIMCERRKLWRKKVEASNPLENPDKHWRLIRILSSKQSHQASNKPIYFWGKCFSKPQAITHKFYQQHMLVGPHTSDRNSHRVIKN
jgi:hypothetical protein